MQDLDNASKGGLVLLLLLWLSNSAAATTTLQFGSEARNFIALQKYTLFFTLNGPGGDGLFRDPSEVQQFMRFHENLTQSFVLRFATLERVQAVITTCRYVAQKSFDFPLNLDPARPGVVYIEPPSQDNNLRHLQELMPEEEDEFSNLLSTLHGNTTYGIVYFMEYSSPTVNVENYTLYYEQVVYESFEKLELGHRSWLDVPATSTLSIKGVYNTQEETVGSTAPNPGQQQENANGFLLYHNDTTPRYNDTEAPSSFPTQGPTTSTSPSEPPTVSPEPSASSAPSPSPSIYPSAAPSSSPTAAPTSHPTFHATSISRGRYEFSFTMSNVTFPEELFLNLTLMCEIFVNMTPDLASMERQNPRHVDSTCLGIHGGHLIRQRSRTPTSAPVDPGKVDASITAIGNNNTQSRRTLALRGDRRQLQNYSLSNYGNWSNHDHNPQTDKWSYILSLGWESRIWDVAGYPDALLDFVQDNQGDVEAALTVVFDIDSGDGTDLTIGNFRRMTFQTQAPSAQPSSSPSTMPTEEKTEEPTIRPTIPTIAPTIALTIPLPTSTMAPTDQNMSKHITLILVVIVVLVFSTVGMFGLLLFYRRRKKRLVELTKYRRPVIVNGEITVELNNGDGLDSYGVAAAELHESHERAELPKKPNGETGSGFVDASHIDDDMSHRAGLAAGAKDSDTRQDIGSDQNKKTLMSSLLSDIDEGNYSSDEHEEAAIDVSPTSQSPPADEFERCKDRNLEKMRSIVEDNVEGLDDMMSQAMTMALMMDGGVSTIPKWYGARTGIEIEANALWEVTEWLKRHGDPELDDKQAYMQTMLSKMVSSVHKGIVNPDEASRTVHECAALLGMQLANQLPVTTIIVSGMQKTTSTADLGLAFKDFGAIESIAVASKHRGFGIVRFKNQNAAALAMERFRTSEIVIKNVAVTLKVLPPEQ